MNLIFFGDDQYSALTAERLLAAYPIHTIVTKDRPGNPMVELAQKYNIPLAYYPHLPTLPADSQGILASFGAILPGELIKQFGEHGILCLHPSLLPQYRGATPGQHAIALGDKTTGITLFRLTPTVDQGEILAQEQAPILETDTTPTLLTRLFTIGSDLLTKRLAGTPTSIPTSQNTKKLVLTRRFTRDTGYIEWPVIQRMLKNEIISKDDTNNPLLNLRLSRGAESSRHILGDLIRALTPWPSVWTTIPTHKGELRAKITQVIPSPMLHLEGKKSPISLADLTMYYLDTDTTKVL